MRTIEEYTLNWKNIYKLYLLLISMTASNKLITRCEALEKVRAFQASGKKVVFSNGCFDILHAGHVEYLTAAKKLGDVLLIGLNSDASVRRLKGQNRPICSEADRAAVLSALHVVDAVTLFDEDTPEELIGALLPDILVKGSDWAVESIAGAGAVLEHGGAVLTIPLLEGRSTSGIIEKIIQLYSQSSTCGGTD
jgi:D-glycero-beta-D-manno-heptose 1-phosphate adenylyltransferase